jgi:serine/threonine-protein phosphatase 2A regulatory subunit A
MASIIGKEYTIQKVIPILIELIKDDNPEVKLNVVTGMVKIANVVREEILSTTLLVQLGNMTKDG